MEAIEIDINCDMGEGLDNENMIMPYISSANISCGLHAGTPKSIQQTIQLAKRYNVNIGAHPSFNDRENFGRKEINLSENEIYELIQSQLKSFDTLAKNENAMVKHIKPHGALYNMSAKLESYARSIAQAVYDYNPSLILFGLSGSHSISAAEKIGLKTKNEVFADRTYQKNGQLTPRSQSHALIDSAEVLIKQVNLLKQKQSIIATDGSIISLQADTLCIHGDGKHAAVFAQEVSKIINQ